MEESRKTAHSWYHELNKKAWSSAFDTRDTQTDPLPEVAVGTPELSVEAALPETLPVLVDCREGDESSDCDLDSCPQLARCQLDIWREHPNFSIGIRLAELATMWLVHGGKGRYSLSSRTV